MNKNWLAGVLERNIAAFHRLALVDAKALEQMKSRYPFLIFVRGSIYLWIARLLISTGFVLMGEAAPKS
jgi:hypothetical protein